MDLIRAGGVGSVVGREPELATLQAYLEAEDGPRALLLSGDPGIGKTTLWEAGIDVARDRGTRVLFARPSGAEAQLAYAALIDLLDGVPTTELDLPPPQQRALEVAIVRAHPAGAVEPRAIAVGFANALRALSGRGPLLVAVDDVQWLDLPSADVLTYAARRLEDEPVRFLLAKRPAGASPLERALERRGVGQLEVGPLSLGATRRLLSTRLGLALPRHVLRRVYESTLGNPLFALELGRSLADRAPPEPGEDIPVPETVEDVMGTHIAGLPEPLRRLLLAIALSADPRVSQITEVVAPAVLEEAIDAGLLIVDADRLRASHPLLAAVAKEHSSAGEQRELHLELAGIMRDAELRAHHLALASVGVDEELAGMVASAAVATAARGAVQDAAALAEHALRLTPPGSAEHPDRLLALAGYLDLAGELRRVTELLRPALASLPPGAPRVRAWLLLAEAGDVRTLPELERHLDSALFECRGDPVLRAHVLAKKSDHAAASAVSRIPRAEAWALESLRDAPAAGPHVERLALLALGWARALRGFPIDDLCERFRSVSDAAPSVTDSPERVAAQRLVWRGEVALARTTFGELLRLADERGEPIAYALNRLHLCEVELRVGAWKEAARLLDEWAESSEGELLIWPMYERCRALLSAGVGLPADAEQWAAQALASAEESGGGWDPLEARRAIGIAALLEREPARAVESLRAVWEHTRREGVEEPGVFPIAPELVEALVELGGLDEAQPVASRLREVAERQEHPWGLVTAKRCDALVSLAAPTYDEHAARDLADAAAAYGELGLRFDRARTLLSLGRAQRRLRKWGASRGSLEQAASAFDELGSTGWAEAARSELARVGARRPRAQGELTEAEKRVVELAIEGKSNKEIAYALVVTVATVERHLSRAYAKLGVRSRTQLAGRLSREPGP